MARSIFCNAINIRLHNTELRYDDLFRFVLGLGQPVRVFGDSHIVLSPSNSVEIRGSNAIVGVAYKYTRIDFDADWINEATLLPATPEQLQNIQIPEGLHPNLGAFYFAFFPDSHKFVFETYGVHGSLSAKMMVRYLDGIFSDHRVSERFGSLEVDIISDRAGVDEVLGLAVLKRVTIEIFRPNPDDFPHDVERRYQERLRRLRAKKQTVEFEASPGESIQVDDELRDLTIIATRNGNAKSYGRDENGMRQEPELQDSPLEKGERYDPDELSEFQAFNRATNSILGSLYEEDPPVDE